MTRRRRSRPIWRASSNGWRPSSHGCGAEPPRASGRPLTLGAGLLGPRDSIRDHDRRPQADRHPVRRDRVRVLPAGRPRGALDPAPARGTGRARRQRRDLQRALHDARHDDGVPRDHAAQRRVLQLHGPPADRRPRRRLPAPQRALLLDLPLRRPVPERELPRGDAPRCRLVRVCQPDVEAVFAESQRRLLAAEPSAPGRLLDDRRDQLHRDDRQHARAGHAAHADAGVRLDDAGRAVPHRARVPADHGRGHLPHVRPVLRQPLLRRRGRRRPPSLAAPLLDLRAPRGLHPDPARLRDRLRGAADLRAQAAVRRAGRRLFGRPDRLLRLRRVEPPHVRRGHGAGRGRRVLDRDHAHRDPDGREDLQLAGDALGRIDPRDDCVPLRGRPRRALHDRRALGHHARLAARGPPADRQLLRRRAPALRAHRRQPLRPLRRRLLLVAEDHRTAPRRAARQAPVLGPLRGLQHDLFPQHYLGAIGMPRRIYTYAGATGWTLWNTVSTVGAFGIAAGVLLFMVNAWRSLRAGAPAPADPWDGRTLEWRTSSPPPPHDFDTIPPVSGRDTFWREKYGRRAGGGGPGAAPSRDHIHLPAPSHWPVLVGLGMAVMAVGALTHLATVLVGALVTVVGVFRFALEHHRNPAHEHQVGSLDLDHRKVAMWVFLGSECFFFGTLIATYLAYKGKSVVGPEPHQILNIPLTTVSTFDLLMSSLLMVLALAAVERGDRREARLWLFGTAFFGLIFLGFQAYEFTHFVGEGLTLQQNLFGSTFFVLTGFHGAHVTVGVVWLLSLWLLDLRGNLGVTDAMKVEVAGLYWHFVDVVWIVIFTLVYLIP